ncbi:MAG: MFS transporter, partial [Rikenellaceae bacterium]
LSLGIALVVVGSIICAISSDLTTLIVGRTLQGISCSAMFITCQTWLSQSSSKQNMVKTFAYFSLVLTIAPIVAPALGGFITEYYSWRASFVLLAVLGVVIFAMVFPSKSPYQYPIKDPKSLNLKSTVKGYIDIVKSPKFRSLNNLGLIFYFYQSMFIAMSSFMIIDNFGLSPTKYGLLTIPIVVALIVGRFPTLYISNKFGNRAAFTFNIVSILLSAIASIAFYAITETYNLWIVLASVTVFNFGFCGYNILSLSSMMIIYNEDKGRVSATNNFFVQVANYLGVLAVQILFACNISTYNIFYLFSIFLLLGTLLATIQLVKSFKIN